MVPDAVIYEPIAWDDIPVVIRRIELAVGDWMARGIPNEPRILESVTLYLLRQLEHTQRALDLGAICET